jgi:4-amino-4-deoxy-L-arabinose transferase-like glycosyltransferase
MDAITRHTGLDRAAAACARLETVVVLVAAATVTATVILATDRQGPGISPDSALYLSVARNVSEGAGLVGYGDQPLVGFPPGFSIALAAINIVFGVGAVTAARVVNALLFGLVLLVSWLILRRLVGSAALRITAVVLLAVAAVLYRSSTFVLSEPLFIIVVLGALLALDEAVRRPRSWGWVVAAAVVAAAAFFVRYAGLVLLPLGFVALLAAGRTQLPARQRGLRASAFTLMVGAAATAWIWRNISVSSEALGKRDPSHASLEETVREAGRALSRLAAPFVFAAPVRGGLVLVVAGLLVWSLAQLRREGTWKGQPLLWLVGGFAGLHLFILLLAARTTEMEWTDDRLLAPVFVTAVIAYVTIVDAAVASWNPERRTPLLPVALGVLLLWAAALAWDSVKWIRQLSSSGAGYTTARWQQSDLARTAKRIALPKIVYSNAPDALSYLTGLNARCWPDELATAPCPGVPTTPSELEKRMGTGTTALIWFSPDYAGRRTSPRLQRGVRILRRLDASDGTVYVIRRVRAERPQDGGSGAREN